jgi:hypothetical protein
MAAAMHCQLSIVTLCACMLLPLPACSASSGGCVASGDAVPSPEAAGQSGGLLWLLLLLLLQLPPDM